MNIYKDHNECTNVFQYRIDFSFNLGMFSLDELYKLQRWALNEDAIVFYKTKADFNE